MAGAAGLFARCTAETMRKYTLSARALNGDSAIFYASEPKNTDGSSGADKFVIWLTGGGKCENQQDCFARKHIPNVGNTRYYAESFESEEETSYLSFYGAAHPISFDAGYGNCDWRAVLSSDPLINPDFADWNHVWLPYVTHDVFQGLSSDPFNPWNARNVVGDGCPTAEQNPSCNAMLTNALQTGASRCSDLQADTQQLFPGVTYADWCPHLCCSPEDSDIYYMQGDLVFHQTIEALRTTHSIGDATEGMRAYNTGQ